MHLSLVLLWEISVKPNIVIPRFKGELRIILPFVLLITVFLVTKMGVLLHL